MSVRPQETPGFPSTGCSKSKPQSFHLGHGEHLSATVKSFGICLPEMCCKHFCYLYRSVTAREAKQRSEWSPNAKLVNWDAVGSVTSFCLLPEPWFLQGGNSGLCVKRKTHLKTHLKKNISKSRCTSEDSAFSLSVCL